MVGPEICCKTGHVPFICGVLFDFILKPTEPDLDQTFLVVGKQPVPLTVIRNHRARRYLLRLRSDGSVRLTIPRRGSVIEGQRFAERNTEWLAKQLAKLSAHPTELKHWLIGNEIFFRGNLVKLEMGTAGTVEFGGEKVSVPDPSKDLRPNIVRHLWQLATKALPPKVHEFAAKHDLKVQRVTVRNQKSRWGSCSRRGTVSLNWRLIQTPAFVQDYIILHELMHLRQMNHSARFWQEVERVCPEYQTAEDWLKRHAVLLK